MTVRAGRRVALVAALAMMVSAGQWLLLSADVPQVAANNWASAGDFGAMPEGTAGASLADGRIVVAGGHYSDGTLVSQVGIYNPASQSWQDGGQLAMARTGHTVTALDDGRVLIAGGRTVNGPSFDVEIYNPNTGQSVHAGDLWVPRVNHAAVELGSGLVLVAGGSNGSGVLDYLELFDSTTGVTQSLTIRLSVAREKLTATRLLDGHVLLAGGRDASGSLAVAEIFASGSRSIFPTGLLRTARSGHTAVLLPNNNQVLIAGGTVNGAPSASAELYADWRDGFRLVPTPMSQARTGAVTGVLPYHDLAFVGGGSSTSGEYFGYATVKTDKADYWPGETVTITGSGWQPGETVALKISEDADTHNDFTYTAVADGQGNISNAQFAPIENDVFHHFGMRFYVTATGVASTALNTFTDGNSTIEGTVINSATNAPIEGALVSCASGCNGNPSILTAANGTYSLQVQFPGNVGTTVTLSVSASGYVGETSDPFLAGHQATVENKNFSLDPVATPTTTVVSSTPNPSTYGGEVTFTATVSPNTATGSVQFKDGGVNLGGLVPVAGGQATFATSALLAGGHSITAVFTASGAFTNSTSAVHPHQVDPKPLTITATNQTKVYGTTVTPSGTEFTTSALVGTDTVTSVTLNSPGYAQTASVAGSPHLITPSAAVGSGLTNYAITYATGNMTVTARPVTVTADAKTKKYGEADPTFTYSLTSGSLVGTDSFSGALGRVSGENVGTYAIQLGTLTLGTNYAITFVSADLSITPATLTVTADAKTKQYGAADPAFSYVAVGFKFSDNAASVLTGLLTRAVGENVGSYAINQGSLVANGNYIVQFVGAALSITPATLTITADAKSKVYGEADPLLTYQSSGFKFSDNAASVLTGLLARAPGENVGNYAINQGTLAANANYTISFTSANLTITTRPITVTADAKSKIYGNADPALTYQVTTGSVVLGDTFSGSLTRAVGENVGTYAIQQGTLTLGANYEITFVGANLTITARPITVTADAKSKIYGNADPTLTYQVTSGTLVTGDAFSGSLTRAVGENVGTYAIQQGTLTLGANYEITFVGANLTITARPITVTADAKSKIYGNADPTLTYQVTAGTLVTGDAFSGSLTRAVGENVGTYAIQQGTLTLGANYEITFVGANLTITARPITVTADAKSKIYGNADPALTYQVTSGTLVTGDAFSGSLTRAVGENVGTYAIQQGTLALSANYELTFVGANLTITARPITVTADAKSKIYGNADPTLTYQVTSGTLVTGDAFSGSLTRAVGENVGTYAIQQGTLTLGANYEIAFVGANLTITARPITVTADAKSKVYGNADPTLTYQVTTGTLVTGDAFSGSLTRAVGENVGTYAIQQGTLTLGANYEITFVGANLTITARPITVTADAKSKVYGNADPTLTYQVTTGTLVTGDAFSGSLTRAVGENVGTYAIQQGTLTLGANYEIAFVGANLTITARPITVTADAKSKVYGNADPTLTYQVTTGTLVTGDAFSGSLTRAVGENVGTYAIQQGTLTLGANYEITFVYADLTITVRPITVTADAKTKTFGDPDPALTYQITTGSLVLGDTFSGELTRVAGQNVGVYAIQQGTLALSANYELTFVGANFTIIKATPVITWNNPAAITYPAPLGGLQLNASADVPGTFVYTPVSGTVLNAGIGQTLHVAFTPTDTHNYHNAVKDVVITVHKADQAITFGALANKTFGDPPVAVSATGGNSGQPVTFSTLTTAVCIVAPNGANAALITIQAVGQCTVTASQAGNLNYNAAPNIDRSFSIGAWTAHGFHQPVGIPNSVFAPAPNAYASLLPAPPSTAVWNSAKGGQTIPLKFNLFAAGVELTSTTDIVGFVARPLSACSATTYDAPLEEFETAGATVLRYDGVAGSGQFIQNWKTPSVKSEQCFRVELTLRDQSILYTFVKLKK